FSIAVYIEWPPMQASAVFPAAPPGGPVRWSLRVPRDLTAQQRWALALSVLVAHGVAAWLMARTRPVDVVVERPPISVQLIAPPQAPPAVAQAAPPPPAPVPPKLAKPKPV